MLVTKALLVLSRNREARKASIVSWRKVGILMCPENNASISKKCCFQLCETQSPLGWW